MKKCFRLLALTLTFIMLFATCAYSAPTINPTLQENDFQLDYEPGQIIVKFKDNCNKQKKEVEMRKSGLSRLKILGDTGAELLAVSKGNMKKALNQLRSSTNVEYATPNYHFRPAGNLNDPLFSRQWALRNTGQEIVDPITSSLIPGTVDIDINAPEAWQSSDSSDEVLVGVLDTGVDISHPDLHDKIWINPGEIPGDGIDNDHNGYVDDIYGWNFADENNQVFDYTNPFADGHGTAVAGVIAANTNNNFGIAGIAPNAKIVCLKFINADGIGLLSDAITALDYAKQQGIKIINASWGQYFPTRAQDSQFYDTELKPLGKAILNSETLFTAAAGNEGYDLDALEQNAEYQYFPAAFEYPNVISVTGVDNRGFLCTSAQHGWGSNTGADTVDIAAPGNNVLSTITVGDFFGAAVEGIRGSSRSALWGFGLQDITGFDEQISLLSRELHFLYPQWEPLTGENSPRVLLVDDDESEATYPDCNEYWTDALNELDINYQNLTTSTNGNRSAVNKMKKYDIVIWQTGRSGGEPSLTAKDTETLSAYIEQGGNLLLSGENAISGNEDWAAEMLQAQLVMEGLPCYDLTGLSGSTYQGFQCILDGCEIGSPPVLHDLYYPINPETSFSGLTFKFTYITGVV